jgi:hypothetical protein
MDGSMGDGGPDGVVVLVQSIQVGQTIQAEDLPPGGSSDFEDLLAEDLRHVNEPTS